MSIETRIIRRIIGWINRRYPYLCLDVVVGNGYHRHKNPPKKGPRVTDAEWLPEEVA